MNQYLRQAQYKKGFANIIVIGIVVLLIGAGVFVFISTRPVPVNSLDRPSSAGQQSQSGETQLGRESNALDERIAFARSGDLYSIRPDGTDEKKLTSGNHDGARQPAWSRNGKKIAFESKKGGSYQIWTMNEDGSNQVQVTRSGGMAGSWTPDGKIVFMGGAGIDAGAASDHYSVGGIYIINADGSGLKLLNENGAVSCVSREEDKIVFVKTIEAKSVPVSFQGSGMHNAIFSMNIDGSHVKQLTFPEAYPETFPDSNAAVWSPDGKQIAFYCGHEGGDGSQASWDFMVPYIVAGTQQICMMNADGSNRRQVTRCKDCISDMPSFSPDGMRVYFMRLYTDNNGRIIPSNSSGTPSGTHIINIDGTNERSNFINGFHGDTGGCQNWRKGTSVP